MMAACFVMGCVEDTVGSFVTNSGTVLCFCKGHLMQAKQEVKARNEGNERW